MRRWPIVAVALLLVIAPPQSAAAQGLIVPCGAVEGLWDWPIGGVVELAPDGSAGWSSAPGMAPMLEAEWHCDETIGQIVITWQQGLADRLRLSVDGRQLKGENDVGVAVEASRHQERPATVAGPTPVPPAMVGTWLLEVQIVTAEGPVPVVWTIEPDGTYAIEAGPLSHAGTMTAHGGSWEQTATTSSFTDGGQYELANWARLVTRARSGQGGWRRIEPGLALQLAEADGQALPMAIPALAGRAAVIARGWRPDATLLGVEFERRDSNQWGSEDAIELRFISPATGGGLVVTATPTGSRFFVHDVVNWGSEPVPEGFLDLPTAWAIARQHGLAPPLDRAGLRVWRPGGEPVLAWQLSAARGEPRGVAIDGVGGGLLDGDLSGYIASYNAQWQAAVDGLRRLFARPAARSSGFGADSDDGSGASSSYATDDDDGSGSTWDRDTGLQNAWGAGDSAAYDRISSGTATGEDCARYGC